MALHAREPIRFHPLHPLDHSVQGIPGFGEKVGAWWVLRAACVRAPLPLALVRYLLFVTAVAMFGCCSKQTLGC